VLIVGGVLAILSGFTMEPLLTHGSTWGVALFLCIELFLMGVTLRRWARCCRNCFRPTCVIPAHRRPITWAALSAPRRHRSSPKLVAMGGLSYVGGYVSAAAVLSLIAVLCLKETRNNDLNQVDNM
jgi:hypothetical protein